MGAFGRAAGAAGAAAGGPFASGPTEGAVGAPADDGVAALDAVLGLALMMQDKKCRRPFVGQAQEEAAASGLRNEVKVESGPNERSPSLSGSVFVDKARLLL